MEYSKVVLCNSYLNRLSLYFVLILISVCINIQCCLFVLIRLGLPIDNIYYYVNINNKLTQEKKVCHSYLKENGS